MKKGFVFIETLTVLTVLVTVILSIFVMYETVMANMAQREYYDNISDIYKTDILRSKIKRDVIASATGTIVKIERNNCTTYMNSSCTNLFTDLNVESIYINLVNISEVTDNDFKNTFKDYIKTIEISNSDEQGQKVEVYNRMIIAVFNYNSHRYFASLNI